MRPKRRPNPAPPSKKVPPPPTQLPLGSSRPAGSPPVQQGSLFTGFRQLPVYRVLSYGGGVDSFAMLLDAIQRKELPHLVIFADVTDPERKDPGEWPETYRHIENVVVPLCAKYGIPFKWLTTDEMPIRGSRSLYDYLYGLNAMVGRMSRLCTSAAKVERIAEWVEAHHPEGPIEMWVGFEAGEEKRAARDPHATGAYNDKPTKRMLQLFSRRISRFPLIERKLCRCRSVELIKNSGYPVPPGSACVFCLAGETPVVTRAGIRPIRELAGGTHALLVPQVGRKGGLAHRGSFKPVEVRSFGVQPLWEVRLHRGRTSKVVRATAEHRWFLAASHEDRPMAEFERTTAVLQPGDRLRTLRATPPARENFMPVAAAQGFTFGDGSRPAGADLRPAQVTFYGAKDRALLPLFAGHPATPVAANGKPAVRIYGLPRFWKSLPPLNESRAFLLSWLAGYFAADGSVVKQGQAVLESASKEALDLVCAVAAICGVGYSFPRMRERSGFGRPPTQLHRVTLRAADLPDWFFLIHTHAERARRAAERRGVDADILWVVDEVKPLGIKEEVFCAVVPGAQAFGLAEDLMTGNCPFSTKGDFKLLKEKYPSQFVAVADLERRAKLTKKGHTIRFAGGASAPLLPEHAASDYKPRQLKCEVCGSPNKVRKNVGCDSGA